MPSLQDTYNQSNNSNDNDSYLISYFTIITGVILTFLGLFVSTTAILQVLYESAVTTSQYYGGIISGTGVLLVFGGVLRIIKDKSIFEKYVGYVGLTLCIFSIVIFSIQFPENWDMYELTTIPLITFLYASGVFVLIFITFNSLINYRLKSDTQFTITHRIGVDEEEIEEKDPTSPETSSTEDRSDTTPSGGGIGLIGKSVPDVEQQYGVRDPHTPNKQDKK